MQPFKVLDHDADIRLEVYGASMEKLFENAAGAVFSLIIDPASVITPSLEKRIIVTGNGELLINFLNELLFTWDVDRLIPASVSVTFGTNDLTATIKGETFNEDKHSIQLEMKAVTYHKFSIVEENGMLKATIIIDV